MAVYYRWRRSQIGYKDNVTLVQTATIYPTWGDNGDRRYATIYSKAMSEGLPDTNGLYWVFENSMNSSQTGDAYVIHRGGSYVGASAQTDIMYCGTTTSQPLELTIPASGNAVTISSNALFEQHKRSYTPGTAQGYVYSTSSTAYPNGGVSGNYYYDQRTTVTSPTAPTGLTYPNPITTPKVTVSWNAATSNVPGVPISYYQVAYRTNPPYEAMPEWHSENIIDTNYQLQIPTGITQIKIWVYAYDSNGNYANASNGYVSVYLAPTLTVPQMVMQGQQATISWTAIEGADSYTVQRKANTDTDWTQVYSGAALTFAETVGTWTSVQYRVQAVFDGTGGGWAESISIPVISASALVISGSDSDLGTLVDDVQYTINTDTGNQITAKVTVNSAVVFSGNVTSGAASTISIFDLVNGTGTIVIEASVQASSGVVNATRTWTYTKAELTFPDTGSIAQLLQKGKNIFPKTLAECIRTSDIWGGDLSSALQKLVNAIICDPDTGNLGSMSGSAPTIPMFEFGSYRGTGSYSSAHMNTLTFSFKPLVLFVFPELPYNSDGGLDAWWFIALNGMTLSQSAHYARGEPDTYFVNLTWNGNSVSWYSNGNAKDQLNSTETYYYAAIGLPGGDE